MACADALLRNQMDIICAWKAFGANFVVIESPIGEINISATITIAQLMISQIGLTLAWRANSIPGSIIQTNERPAAIKP